MEQEFRSIPIREENVAIWRQQLVRNALRALVIFGTLALVAGAYYAISTGSFWVIPFYSGAYLGLVFVTFWRRIPYGVQAWALIGLIYGLGVLDLIDSGRGGDGRVFLLTVPMIAVLLLGKREGIAALVVDVLTLAVFTWIYSTGRITIPVERQANYANPAAWISNTVVLLMLGTLLVASQSYIVPRLSAALTQSRKLVEDLNETQTALYVQAEALKTTHRLLQERAKTLEAVAQVAREAASISDLPVLLNRVVSLISERFRYYHAGIFLLDPGGEWAILQAASSPGGQQMLARGHRLQAGRVGIVGFVAASGQPRIASDVGLDPTFFDNPDLPDTRSEMALPLLVRGEVTGILDIQSSEADAFHPEDIEVLESLADEVAMVISNARLYQQAQASLEQERRAYGELSRKAWRELLQRRGNLTYHYEHDKVVRLTDDAASLAQADGELPELELPIEIRGNVFGSFKARKPAQIEWTKEETGMLGTLLEQLSVALESARLYEDTQRRAERERLAGAISTKLRATNDPQAILQTAVRELREALQVKQTQILIHNSLPVPPAEGQGKDQNETGVSG